MEIKNKNIILLPIIITLIIFTNASAKEIETIKGNDRILTSLAVSQMSFSQTDAAIIVNGYNFADALSSLSLAKKYKAPILLTRKEELEKEIVDELNRLDISEVFIVGGTNVVSSAIEKQLDIKYRVTRLFGDNRYETNRAVNNFVFKDKNLNKNIYIANGNSFADVLSIGPIAFYENAPIILTDLNGEYLEIPYTDIDTIYIIGGEKNISISLEEKLEKPVRIAGRNRFITSELIDSKFYPDSSEVFVTTGQTFADAISAIPLTKGIAPLRLADKYVSEINDNRDKTIIGGMIKDDVSSSSNVALYLNPHQDDETISMGTQLVRDINIGRDVHILQFTKGEKTITLERINARLLEEGYEKIDALQLGKGRTNEMRSGLVELGVPYENIIEYPYLQYEASAEKISNNIASFVSKFPDKNIHFRILDNSLEYDKSAGRLDHQAVKEGLDLYIKNNKTSNIYIASFLGTNIDEPIKGYKRIYRTPEENNLWKVLYDNYGIWDPENERYSVGHYSVKSSFDKALENKLNHVKYNYYIKRD